MNNVASMRMRQALAALNQNPEHVLDRYLLAARNERLQIAPVDVLGDDEVSVLGRLRDVQNVHDVRVMKTKRLAQVAEEHGDELLVLREARQDTLDRDVLLAAITRLHHAAKHARTSAKRLGD